ncbi:MAG: dienelactone hydrolase family protein [Gemmatimonadota bacterium]
MRVLVLLSLLALAVPAGAQQPYGNEGMRILAQLFTYDATLPLHARTLDRFDTLTFMREKFVMDGWRGSRVPGFIAVPKSGSPPFPVVVLIDGIGGWKERWWQRTSWNRGRVLIDSLIANGFAVAMIDAPASGERTYENGYVTAESFVGKQPQLRDLEIQNTIEHRRLLDLLTARADIDSTRIGVLGLSLGGRAVFYLGAFEPRVRAAVAGVTALQRMPELFWSGHYAPRVKMPLLMLMGRSDAYYTEEQAERVLELIGSRDKQLVWYDTGHRLPEDYAGAAAAWFERYLQ